MQHNKSYKGCIFNQIKPIFATYFLHILQGQAPSFHTLISFLNSFLLLLLLLLLLGWR